MKHARAFAILQVAFAIDLARVAADREVDVLSSRLREVHSWKRTHRPVRLMVRVPVMPMLHQRELDLPRLIGLADRPTPAMHVVARIRRASLNDEQNRARRKHDVSKRSTHSHKVPSYGKTHVETAASAVRRSEVSRSGEAKRRQPGSLALEFPFAVEN